MRQAQPSPLAATRLSRSGEASTRSPLSPPSKPSASASASNSSATGLSASFLSQLETGRVVPTLRNLARIAMVFSRDMSYFFTPEEPEVFRIVRAADRQRLPQTGTDEPGYFFESLGYVPLMHAPADQRIAPYIAEFLPATDTRKPRSHQHPGAEFLYVLSGQLTLTHDGQEDVIDAGDAVYFHSNTPHSYERTGEETCTALILTLPLGFKK